MQEQRIFGYWTNPFEVLFSRASVEVGDSHWEKLRQAVETDFPVPSYAQGNSSKIPLGIIVEFMNVDTKNWWNHGLLADLQATLLCSRNLIFRSLTMLPMITDFRGSAVEALLAEMNISYEVNSGFLVVPNYSPYLKDPESPNLVNFHIEGSIDSSETALSFEYQYQEHIAEKEKHGFNIDINGEVIVNPRGKLEFYGRSIWTRYSFGHFKDQYSILSAFSEEKHKID